MCAENWGKTFGAHGQPTSTWRQLVNVPADTPTCPLANVTPALLFGARHFMLVGGSISGTPYQATSIDASWTPVGSSPSNGVSPGGGASFPLAFDGVNFLTVPDIGMPRQLTALRFNDAGARLDPQPFALTPDDGWHRSSPALGGDRASRYAVAYKHARDHGVYVRLFSTCP